MSYMSIPDEFVEYRRRLADGDAPAEQQFYARYVPVVAPLVRRVLRGRAAITAAERLILCHIGDRQRGPADRSQTADAVARSVLRHILERPAGESSLQTLAVLGLTQPGC